MNDLRFAFRQLLKNPGFTIVAALTLALGIGANTAIFSVVSHVLLRPLPFKEPERLVTLWERNPARGYEMNNVSPGTFADWKTQTDAFDGMAAFGLHRSLNLTGDHEPERIVAVPVSANLFSILGVHPLHGRTFLPEEETPGNHSVIILSHALWKRRFGADPNIIGKTIALDGHNHTVVGVMPPKIIFPGMTGILMGFFFSRPADIWLPLALPSESLSNRSNHSLFALARLKGGVPLAQAAAQMDALMQRIATANPGELMGTHAKLISLHEQSVGNVRTGLLVLLGAVAFVLLIACANVANLFLARAAARQKEIAVRVAVGASRGQIIRQLLTESVLLAVLGGLLGTLFAYWSLDALLSRVGESIAITTPGWSEIRLDRQVFAFTLVVSLATGLAFGLAPALRATKLDLSQTLKEGQRGAGGSDRFPLRRSLVVMQTALVMVLLIGAGLMLQSFLRLQNVPAGFNTARVLTMELSLPDTRYPKPPQWAVFYEQLLLRIKALPGVQAAGATTQLPLSGDIGNTVFQIEGRPPPPPGEWQTADWITATPGYFGAMQIPLHAGRLFTEQDRHDSARVCVINRNLADRYFPDENPIGKRLVVGLDQSVTNEIVGIVRDVRQRTLTPGEDLPAAIIGGQIYLPYQQFPIWSRLSIVVRTASEPLALANAVRRELAAMDKDVPASRVRTMDMVRGNSIAQPRFRALLIGVFATLAFVLAVIGIYGVVAYTVTRRTHEIGVRMALGAQTRDVIRLFVRKGMKSVLLGIAIGAVSAFALGRLLASLLFEVKPGDPLTFAAVAFALAGAAFLACFIPARRAAKVHPMEALRYE
jgi:putative ABC transport system permease protein